MLACWITEGEDPVVAAVFVLCIIFLEFTGMSAFFEVFVFDYLHLLIISG